MKRGIVIFLSLLLGSLTGVATGNIVNTTILSTLVTQSNLNVYNANVSVPNGKIVFGANSGVSTLGLLSNAITNVSTINANTNSTMGSLTSGTGSISKYNGSTYFPIVYSKSGAAIATTLHGVYGTITGTGGSVTVTLSGAAVFASSNYLVIATDTTTHTDGLPSSLTSTSFSIVTTNTHTYAYYAEGI